MVFAYNVNISLLLHTVGKSSGFTVNTSLLPPWPCRFTGSVDLLQVFLVPQLQNIGIQMLSYLPFIFCPRSVRLDNIGKIPIDNKCSIACGLGLIRGRWWWGRQHWQWGGWARVGSITYHSRQVHSTWRSHWNLLCNIGTFLSLDGK